MCHVAQPSADARGVEQRLKPGLALLERQRAQIFSPCEQKIEREQDEVFGFTLRQRGLQGAEARQAARIERHGFSVDHAVGESLAVLGNGGEAVGPIKTCTGAKMRPTAGHAHLHAVAVEFDLVRPAGPLRRLIDQLRELRFDKCRYLGNQHRLGARKRTVRGWGARRFALRRLRRPHRVCSGGGRRSQHERFGTFAGAVGNLLERAPGCDRVICLQQRISAAGLGIGILVFDQ